MASRPPTEAAATFRGGSPRAAQRLAFHSLPQNCKAGWCSRPQAGLAIDQIDETGFNYVLPHFLFGRALLAELGVVFEYGYGIFVVHLCIDADVATRINNLKAKKES